MNDADIWVRQPIVSKERRWKYDHKFKLLAGITVNWHAAGKWLIPHESMTSPRSMYFTIHAVQREYDVTTLVCCLHAVRRYWRFIQM